MNLDGQLRETSTSSEFICIPLDLAKKGSERAHRQQCVALRKPQVRAASFTGIIATQLAATR